MRRTSIVLVALLLVGVLGCERPDVLQGTVVAYDKEARTLVVRDELPPNREVRFDVSEAEFGAEPKIGDVVRIAWTGGDEAPKAGRVMNVTRQAERGH